VVSTRRITAGEELTLDYADFLDATTAPFVCQCGAPSCRGRIEGTPGINVTVRSRAAANAVQ
jgi:hypothetical protein